MIKKIGGKRNRQTDKGQERKVEGERETERGRYKQRNRQGQERKREGELGRDRQTETKREKEQTERQRGRDKGREREREREARCSTTAFCSFLQVFGSKVRAESMAKIAELELVEKVSG